MRVRLLLVTAMALIAALTVAQQSGQSTTPPASTPQSSTMPQPSAQQPIGQPTSTPPASTQQSMTMSQSSDQEPMVKSVEQTAFKTSPSLPDCVTFTVDRGDPKTGPSVTFVKVASGCTVPWHWHSANEQTMFVSGTAQVQPKGQQVQTASEGSYVYMPAKHQHQLTCPNGCTFYVIRDGATDYHYVDTAGNEITPETALAAVGEHPAKIVASQQ